MCDFRNVIAVVIDGQEIPAEHVGHSHDFNFLPVTKGIWHIGASGCGLYYWSGDQWYSDYGEYEEGDICKPCKFITDGSMDLLIDVREYKPNKE